jgi:hypothetical protein
MCVRVQWCDTEHDQLPLYAFWISSRIENLVLIKYNIGEFFSMWWWPEDKNSTNVARVCCKRRLKWVPSAWVYSCVTLSPGGHKYGGLALKFGGWAWDWEHHLVKILLSGNQTVIPTTWNLVTSTRRGLDTKTDRLTDIQTVSCKLIWTLTCGI